MLKYLLQSFYIKAYYSEFQFDSSVSRLNQIIRTEAERPRRHDSTYYISYKNQKDIVAAAA